MSGLIECISGMDTIGPFSDVSLRILMRVADVLMNKNYVVPFDILNDNSDNSF
jgi:hypothetical protein